MRRLLMTLAAAGALCAANLPAVAQTGRIDPGLSTTMSLPLTDVRFGGGGHRIRPGGGHGRPGGGFGRPGRPGGGFHGGRPGRPGGWHGRPGFGGGYYGGYHRRHRGYGVGAGVAGLAAGALIGGAIASQAAPYYGAQPVYAAPPDGDAVAACARRFKSYDPNSGTYLAYDGRRKPCP